MGVAAAGLTFDLQTPCGVYSAVNVGEFLLSRRSEDKTVEDTCDCIYATRRLQFVSNSFELQTPCGVAPLH